MKVLFALETFYPRYRAGTETYALNLARGLRNLGIEVEFLTPAFDGQVGAYDFDSFKVRCFSSPSEATAEQMNGLCPPPGFSRAIEEVKQSSPDIFHLHSLTKSFSGVHLKAVKEMGVGTVLTPHMAVNFCARGDLRYLGREGCDGHIRNHRCLQCYAVSRGAPECYASSIAHIISLALSLPILSKSLPAAFHLIEFKKNELRRLRKYCDVVIALAPWIEKLLHINNITATRFVSQAVSCDFTKKIQGQKQKEGKSTLRVGYVGRGYPLKGLHWFLDAADNLKEESIRFHIVTGSNSDMQYYRDQQNKASVLPSVVWEENLSQAEVCQRMVNWDILCLPSTTEMAPLVMLEAAACGLPVVGSDIPAISDYIKDGLNGFLFPVGDVASITRILRMLVESPSLLKRIRDGIESPRGFDKIAMEMQEIYSCILLNPA